ncbi:MAG: acyl-CoA dehydrogenase [Spirochaetes bacterium]|nr:acyl-CoA dehydrogenase [Spirochaetota bacterium]
MNNLLVNVRDQRFTLYEMLDIEKELCTLPQFSDHSRDMYDMTIDVAVKLAVEEVFPAMMEGDREGCRYEDGSVTVPKCFHRLLNIFNEGGWSTTSTSVEAGGQGLPYTLTLAIHEAFVHNFAFLSYPFLAVGAGHLVEKYGTERQKRIYMEKMYAGQWGGTMALTEPEAGSDVGSLKTKAVKQSDGTYRVTGSKIFITSAENDLFENIVNPVLARIEGDPAGTKGISIFLVPKFVPKEDGTLGRRNDIKITGIEHKMGIRASATCSISMGDNGDCYAELLGEERKGMKIMFQLMNEARIGVGIQGLGAASAAYLHALNYARERVQGANLMQIMNPDAPRVPIIQHADVRRMLLWMKTQVEGMRALIFYCGLCFDKSENLPEGEERDMWHGMLELLTPLCKAYCSDTGFRVTEEAIQVYGGYGYCQDYPVEQLMRDVKIASIYEGTNGIQALDLVARKLGQRKGANFINLLAAMGGTLKEYGGSGAMKELVPDFQAAVGALGETGMFFANCGKEGKFMVPVAHAVPFQRMMGVVVLGWLLFWQGGIAARALDAIMAKKGVDAGDAAARSALIKDDAEAAFYDGKVQGARYYMKNVLPEAAARAAAIKNSDLSVLDIGEESF